jgi:hypothetical protein
MGGAQLNPHRLVFELQFAVRSGERSGDPNRL